jgi:proline dehydrogenase
LSGLGADVYLEIVPSHLGIDVSVDLYRRHVERILKELPQGSRLQISAEESTRAESILEGTRSLARDGALLTQTVQANLLRSDRDIDSLIQANVPIRLVKEAYLEPQDVARPWGEQTDVAYIQLAHKIKDAGNDLALATHDPLIREALLAAFHKARFEMLLGVREQDARDLVAHGHGVRIYVPFGNNWFRYWMRRVAESRGP